MKDKALKARDILKQWLLEKFGSQVQPDHIYRPWMNSIEVKIKSSKGRLIGSHYFLVSKGEIYIQSPRWSKIDSVASADVFNKIEEYLDNLYDSKDGLELDNPDIEIEYIRNHGLRDGKYKVDFGM